MANHGKPLTAKQKQFVDAYLSNGGDASAAARAAGYSASTAHSRASDMLAEPNIADVIRRRQKRAADKAQITAERVMRELAAIATAKMSDATDWDDQGVRPKPSTTLDDATAAAVASVTPTQYGVVVKMHDKNTALNTIARALAMLSDNVNVKTDVLNEIREMIAREDDAAG